MIVGAPARVLHRVKALITEGRRYHFAGRPVDWLERTPLVAVLMSASDPGFVLPWTGLGTHPRALRPIMP